MQNKIAHILIAAAMALFSSCEPSLNVSPAQLVVEGFIEDGGYPVVMLTTTVPVNGEPICLDNLSDYVVNWGKVTVSDGEKSVILTGIRSRSYPCGYIYTTADLKGEAGKTYTLKAEYSGKVATATTTIPHAAKVGNISKVEIEPGYYVVNAEVELPADAAAARVFTTPRPDSLSYRPCVMGIVKPSDKNVTIFNAITPAGVSENRGYYPAGSEAYLKVGTLDEASLSYFDTFERSATLGHNYILPSIINITGNVSGGIGVFYGMSTCTFKVEF